jgi:hypothetical protein
MYTFTPNEIESSTSILDNRIGNSSTPVRPVTPAPTEICSDHCPQLMYHPTNGNRECLLRHTNEVVSAIHSSERCTLSLSPTLNIDESRSLLLLSDESITGDSPHRIHEIYDSEEYDTDDLSMCSASDDEIMDDLDQYTSSLMQMSLEDITALEESLARELMNTQKDMIDVGKMILHFETN